MDLHKLHNQIFEELSYEDSRTLLAQMQQLFDSPAWLTIAKYLEVGYRSNIADIAASPVRNSSDIYQQEYNKGYAQAFLAFLQLPGQLEDFAKANVEQLDRQQEDLEDGWQERI